MEYISNLAKQRKRVTSKEQRVGKVKVKAPLSHLTGKWRKHALDGEKITPNYYEAAAFEALKGRVRSGDMGYDKDSFLGQPFAPQKEQILLMLSVYTIAC